MSTARYRVIGEELRRRINTEVYPVGSKLPSIAALMEEFDVKGLNTIRDAERMLVDEGMLRPEHGVGVWVTAKGAEPTTPLQILDDLRRAQSALGRAIAHLEEAQNV